MTPSQRRRYPRRLSRWFLNHNPKKKGKRQAMTQTTVVFGALLIAARLYAQESPRPHWGFQGDIGGISFPKFAVEKIDALPERPSVSGMSYQVGLVRFHANGA